MLEHIITELCYLLSHLHSVEAACLLGGLQSNKKDLIASNDKADTKAPDAIIKSGLINQTRVWRVVMRVMTRQVTDERQESWTTVEWWTLGVQTGRGVQCMAVWQLTFYLWWPGKEVVLLGGVWQRAGEAAYVKKWTHCGSVPQLYTLRHLSVVIINYSEFFSQLNCQSFSISEHYTFKFLIDLGDVRQFVQALIA